MMKGYCVNQARCAVVVVVVVVVRVRVAGMIGMYGCEKEDCNLTGEISKMIAEKCGSTR